MDLKVMGIYDVPYIDTQAIDKFLEGAHQTKKLKVLCEKYLNAQIQEGHHSSIIDARSSLALFLKMKSSLGLELDGPLFLGSSEVLPFKNRRRKNRLTSN